MIRRVRRDQLTCAVWPLADEAAVDALEQHRKRSADLLALDQELTDLLMRALERIVHDEIALAPNHICAIVQAELEKLRSERDLTVLLHPDDVPLVAPWAQAQAAPLRLQAEAGLERGDAILVTADTRVDARVATKLRTLRNLLRGPP